VYRFDEESPHPGSEIELATMDKRAAIIHVVVCIVIGGLIAAFTPAKWLAASLWVSAAMYINGSIAVVEDAQPGGFDNPDGAATSPLTKGWSSTWFALRSLAVTIALAALGLYVQFR
jgi:hypothetical protein